MKKNVGSYDVALRFVLSCLVVLLGRHVLGWWTLLALVPLVSAASGFCLFYAALGISTTTCDETESAEEKAMRATHERSHA